MQITQSVSEGQSATIARLCRAPCSAVGFGIKRLQILLFFFLKEPERLSVTQKVTVKSFVLVINLLRNTS